MHEYGLAADIARRVEARARRSGARRLAVLDVEVGALDRLSPDHLAFWLREALGEAVGAASISVLRAPLSLTCLRCGHLRTVAPDDDELAALDPAFSRCPACRSFEVEVDGKAGCRIRALQFEP